MAKDTQVQVRCTYEERELWKRAAGPSGLSAWLRGLANVETGMVGVLEGAVGAAPFSAADNGLTFDKATNRKRRSGMCVHRVPVGTYCKRCD